MSGTVFINAIDTGSTVANNMSKEECLVAKKHSLLGSILAIAGSIVTLIIIVLLSIVYFVDPFLAVQILVFMFYFGWILGIVAIVLLVIGHHIKRRISKACSIL
jgi:hypothetical protein